MCFPIYKNASVVDDNVSASAPIPHERTQIEGQVEVEVCKGMNMWHLLVAPSHTAKDARRGGGNQRSLGQCTLVLLSDYGINHGLAENKHG